MYENYENDYTPVENPTEYDRPSLSDTDVLNETAEAVYGHEGAELPEGVGATDYMYSEMPFGTYRSRLLDLDGDGIYETTDITRMGENGPDAVLYSKDLDGDGVTDREEEYHFRTVAEETENGEIIERVKPETEIIRVDSDGDGSFDVKQVRNAVGDNGLGSANFEVSASMVRDGNTDEWRTVNDNPQNVQEIEQTMDDKVKVYNAFNDTGENAGDDDFVHIDSFEVDEDGDGFTDFGAYTYASDVDGDGQKELIYEEIYDYDGDGMADWDTIYVDLDNDGKLDMEAVFVSTDTPGEYQLLYSEMFETGMDVPNYETDTTPASQDSDKTPEVIEQKDVVVLPPIEYDPKDYDRSETGTKLDELGVFDPETADPERVEGDPAASMEYWEYQGETNRCAVYSQKFVIAEFTNTEIDIEDLCDMAESNGWFNEDLGTYLNNMDKILNAYGIETDTGANCTINDLENALNNGDKIVVAVDAAEYAFGWDDDLYCPGMGAGHAVEVIGIDRSDPEHPMVILNDSGAPNGKGEAIPLETFMASWNDTNNFAVIAHRP